MHVISKAKLEEFWLKRPDSEKPLLQWYKVARKTTFSNFVELKALFNTADLIRDNLVVFDIGGNRYRLIASIHFNRGKLYIREVLTHAEYSKKSWK